MFIEVFELPWWSNREVEGCAEEASRQRFKFFFVSSTEEEKGWALMAIRESSLGVLDLRTWHELLLGENACFTCGALLPLTLSLAPSPTFSGRVAAKNSIFKSGAPCTLLLIC
jgi:hypothetical protein